MNAALREGLRLRAIRNGWEPFRLRLERRVPILSDSLLWTSISVPGDASRPLGVLLGKRYEIPSFYLCEDPRSQESLVKFFAAIAAHLEDAVETTSPFLQLIVGDTADLRHLVSTALRAGHVGPSDPWNPQTKNASGAPYDPELVRQARRLGLLLSHPAIVRAGHSHQAAVVVLTSELSEHIVTALSDSERENLAIQLAYAEPGLGYGQRRDRAVAAVKAPSDHRLLGIFDDNITLALDALKSAEEGERAAVAVAYAEEVRALLQPLRAMHEAAYDLLASFEPEGAAATHISESEREAFEAFKLHLASVKAETHYLDKNGAKRLPNPIHYLTGRQGVKPSIQAFVRQEQFQELDELAMIRKDPVARASAILDGSVVRGRVRAHEAIGRVSLLEIVTEQEVAEFEESDDVEILDWKTRHDPQGTFSTADGTIESLTLEGTSVIYSLRLKRLVRMPLGTVVEIAHKAFSSSKIFDVSERRMNVTPWTHTDEIEPPAVAPHATSDDRVAELFGKL